MSDRTEITKGVASQPREFVIARALNADRGGKTPDKVLHTGTISRYGFRRRVEYKTLTEEDWAYADMAGLRFYNCRFDRGSLRSALMSYSSFQNCAFEGVEFGEADFERSVFSDCKFADVDLRYVDTTGTIFDDCAFERIRINWTDPNVVAGILHGSIHGKSGKELMNIHMLIGALRTHAGCWDDFIPLAEQLGVDRWAGEILLEHAKQEFERWKGGDVDATLPIRLVLWFKKVRLWSPKTVRNGTDITGAIVKYGVR